jgi:hypothetical protein
MRKVYFLLMLLLVKVSAFAQGKIIFKNIGIPKADGSGTYNVHLRDYASGGGLGLRAGGATLGLFLPGSSTPFATSVMGTSASASFFAVSPPSQTVTVPGQPPGARAILIVRAWTSGFIGSTPSGEWAFTTLPLGGVPADGGPEIPTPSLTGWGPEDGSGIAVVPWPPVTHAWGPVDGAIYAAPATIQINASYGGDPGCTATNFAVYAGPIVVANLNGNEVPLAGFPRTFLTPALGPGQYSIYSLVDAGYGSGAQFLSTGRIQSNPINITVVDPVDIALTPAAIANGQLTFQYTANPGLAYTVQTSTNLINWQPIETNKPTSSPALSSRPLTDGSSGFYRVERLPNP